MIGVPNAKFLIVIMSGFGAFADGALVCVGIVTIGEVVCGDVEDELEFALELQPVAIASVASSATTRPARAGFVYMHRLRSGPGAGMNFPAFAGLEGRVARADPKKGLLMTDQPTRPSSETRDEEARDAKVNAGADTKDLSQSAPDDAKVDKSVSEHEKEMAERGVEQEGEGRIP